ncbi:hypothetical protein GJ496_001985 [Pomphorhynchus laevis]|nr:hypothetical protein GJ496_001985 [Pomphorhynchus laevis]
MSTVRTTDELLNRLPSLAAWLLVLILSGLYFLFIAPAAPVPPWFIAVHLVHFILICVQFALACRIDPGFYPSNINEGHNEFPNGPASLHTGTNRELLVRGIRIRTKWCTTCEFYRPPRCSHCSECDRCVEQFDHHCPWLNNCVGRRNYPYFFRFLSLLTVHALVVCAVSIFVVLINRQQLSTPEAIISLCVLAFTGLLNFPIFGLFGFHVVLVARGRTTNEQVTGKYKEVHDAYTNGCVVNICRLFFAPAFPSLQLPRRRRRRVKNSEERRYCFYQKQRHRYGSLQSNPPEELRSLNAFRYNHSDSNNFEIDNFNVDPNDLKRSFVSSFPLIDSNDNDEYDSNSTSVYINTADYHHNGSRNDMGRSATDHGQTQHYVEYDNVNQRSMKFTRSESYRQAAQQALKHQQQGALKIGEPKAPLLKSKSTTTAKYEISV